VFAAATHDPCTLQEPAQTIRTCSFPLRGCAFGRGKLRIGWRIRREHGRVAEPRVVRRSLLMCALAVLGLSGAAHAATPSPGGVVYGSSTAQHLGDRIPLQRGMSGHDVKVLQDALTRLGRPVPMTGTFGPQTQRALRSWERSANRRVNGRVDRGDLAGLLRAFDSSVIPPPILGATATINADGTATPPAGAPQVIVDLFTAANKIATLPYRYGGGHKSFTDTAYDCSGSVSFALHGAGLLDYTMDSTMLESFGDAGPGQWVTIYANADHTFLTVAGVRFDTSGQSAAGTRWQPAARSTKGFVVRHPTGL
jgi:peptidoglycan hydrolase-like protein with peptidoglycan-binding domain